MRAYLLIAAISAVVTFLLTWLTLKISHRYKLYPQIRARDVHTKPTPRLGGVAMFGGFVVALAAAGAFGWFKSVFANPVQIIAIVAAALSFVHSVGLRVSAEVAVDLQNVGIQRFVTGIKSKVMEE